MKKILMAVAAGIFGFAVAALAQTIIVPQNAVVNPTDLFQIIPGGVPSAQNKYVTPPQITSQSGYAKFSPVTGFSYTFGNSQSYIVLTNSTTIAAGTITFAPAPSDGARECVWAQNTVTTLALAAASGQTLDNAVTTLSAATAACYLYSASNATWDRN
jgi:hypothetical protein